jgi:hypothetical protein
LKRAEESVTKTARLRDTETRTDVLLEVARDYITRSRAPEGVFVVSRCST